MTETTSGHYEAAYTIPAGVNMSGAAIVGRLTAKDGTQAPLIQAQQTLTIDTRPPSIDTLCPETEATISGLVSQISAHLSDGAGSGVDASSIRAIVDGVNVTSLSTSTSSSIVYRPRQPVALGKHTVSIFVSDKAGNDAEQTWEFTVNPPSTEIESVEVSPSSSVLGEQEPIVSTLRAQPSGSAVFGICGLSLTRTMREVQPGLYRAMLVLEAGDSIDPAQMYVRFTPSAGQAITAFVPNATTITTAPPRSPVIVAPIDGDQVGESFAIHGRALPGLKVDVQVKYASLGPSGVFGISGTAFSDEVGVDTNGEWKVERVELNPKSLLGRDRDTDFTIEAIAVDHSSNGSTPATIKITRQ